MGESLEAVGGVGASGTHERSLARNFFAHVFVAERRQYLEVDRCRVVLDLRGRRLWEIVWR